MSMRTSTPFFLFVALQLVLLSLLATHAASRKNAAIPELIEKRTLVRAYGLTDLCLFTEARYTRHPALANRHSPFQDGPLALEHFPSGAIAGPPPALLSKCQHD